MGKSKIESKQDLHGLEKPKRVVHSDKSKKKPENGFSKALMRTEQGWIWFV